jgi:hypothetical protein
MRNLIPAAMAAALVGCGGGSSSGSSSGPTPSSLQAAPLPAQAASPAFALVNLTAADNNGNTFTMAISELVETGTVSSGGQSYPYSLDSVTIVDQNNIAQLKASSEDFYQSAPYMPVGSVVPLGSMGIINSTMLSDYYDLDVVDSAGRSYGW